MKTHFLLLFIGFALVSCQNNAPIQELTPKRIGVYFGFENTKGELQIPAIYDNVDHFKNGYARAQKDGLWGFISETGDTLIDFQYEFVEPFSNGYAPAKQDGQWILIDKKGNAIECANEQLAMANSHLIPTLRDNHWYFIQEDGRLLDPKLTQSPSGFTQASVVP